MLGGLRRDTTEIGRGNFDINRFTDLGVRSSFAGVVERKFVMFIDNIFNDHQRSDGADGSGLPVNVDAEFTGWANRLFGRLQQSLFDGFQQDFLVDAFFALQIF